MEIVWTPEAEATFYNNIDYLEEFWTIKIANEFEEKTKNTIQNIVQNPNLGRFDARKKYNRILIVSQISLIYEIKHNQIVLLLFWDNRQKPIKNLFV